MKISIQLKHLKVFLIALVVYLAFLFAYLLISPIQRTLYVKKHLFIIENLWHQGWSIIIQTILAYAVKVIFAGQIIHFLISIKRDFQKYSRQIADFYSNLSNKSLDRAEKIFNSFVAISIISIVIYLLGRSFFWDSIFLFVIQSFSISILFFIFSYDGNPQNHTVTNFYKDSHATNRTTEDSNSKDLKLSLIELFVVDEIYKNSNLKLTDIALRLNSNRTYVSNIVNKEFTTSFCTFVNQFRMIKVKELLMDEEYENHTLEAISEEVGFGSIHSFIRVFKEMEGTTPGNYRKAQKAKKLVHS